MVCVQIFLFLEHTWVSLDFYVAFSHTISLPCYPKVALNSLLPPLCVVIMLHPSKAVLPKLDYVFAACFSVMLDYIFSRLFFLVQCGTQNYIIMVIHFLFRLSNSLFSPRLVSIRFSLRFDVCVLIFFSCLILSTVLTVYPLKRILKQLQHLAYHLSCHSSIKCTSAINSLISHNRSQQTWVRFVVVQGCFLVNLIFVISPFLMVVFFCVSRRLFLSFVLFFFFLCIPIVSHIRMLWPVLFAFSFLSSYVLFFVCIWFSWFFNLENSVSP